MTNLANIKRTMTSREIAEYTGKRHSDVMEAIRTMEPAWEKVNGRKFPLVKYKDAKGEMRPEYQLSKTDISKPDGTVLVSTTPKVTGKGQVYFVNKLLKGQEA